MTLRWIPALVATGTFASLIFACSPAPLGSSGTTGSDPNPGESSPQADTTQLGVSIPAALAQRTTSSTLAIKLNFASKADYDNTKYLGILFVKGADATASCGKVWSKNLDLTDPARINLVAYPRESNTVLYEPGEGDVSLFIYTFTTLPPAFCLADRDCAANDATPSALDASTADADAGSSSLCRASGAGLGLCGAGGPTDPTSGGCAVVKIVDKGNATAEVNLTARP